VTGAEEPDAATVQRIRDRIIAEVGEQIGDLFSAIPVMIWDHYPPYQRMDLTQRQAWNEAVTRAIEGSE
jgi:hypothetical protein